MRKFRVLIVVGAIATGGCNLSTSLPTSQRVGLVNVVQLGGGDTATMRLEGVFFQTTANASYGIPNSGVVGDSCNVADYSGPGGELPLPTYDNLNAGPSIAITTDKAEATMVPAVNSAGTVVYTVATGPAPFTPGSQLSLEIPGDSGGFPAQSLKVNTLVTPTFAPIERHPTGDLHLSWSPAGNQGGAIQLQFLFSSDSNTSPNKSMICALRDDGSFDIPQYVVSYWADSPDEAQSVAGFRWFAALQQKQDVLMDVILQVEIAPATFVTNEEVADDIRVRAND